MHYLQARHLAHKLDKEGGFTASLGGYEPVNGFAVSIFKDKEWETDNVSPMEILAYCAFNERELQKTDHYIGGWRDTPRHKSILDVVVVVPDAASARALAEQHAQVAFYDLTKGETIYVTPQAIAA